MAKGSDHSAEKDATNPGAQIDVPIVLNHLPVGLFVCELHGEVMTMVMSNTKALEMVNAKSKDLPSPIANIIDIDENQLLISELEYCLGHQEESKVDWSRHIGVVERHFAASITFLDQSDEKNAQVICTISDITSEKLAEKNLLHHAYHDSLTGLPNRSLFRNRLEQAVRSKGFDRECESKSAVLIINIDRFQQINETFGHSIGDEFLVAIAATLRRCVQATDTLARLSGDEFAILRPHYESLEEVESIVAQIHQAMRTPYELDHHKVYTSVSVGVTTSEVTKAHPEELIRDADYAMHMAKVSNNNNTEYFEQYKGRRNESSFHVETELRQALDRNELELHYQPVVDLDNGDLRGFEALTRWKHKDRGFVSPVEFIPLAEQTGLIVDIGKWAMETACQQSKIWNDMSDKPVMVNVNVSGIQFAKDDVPKMIDRAIAKTGAQPQHLTVELTESTIIGNPRAIAQVLQEIRDRDIKVALDDFGTGYSSLNYLHQFPIDCIKIDRSFIVQMTEGSQKFAILDLISTFGKKLGLYLVAEGIEDIDHVNMLQKLNIEFAQGFYYSRAINAEKATALVTGSSPWAS